MEDSHSKMDYYSNEISKLIEELSSLPGIGAKSAQRLAFHILNMPEDHVEALSSAILSAKHNVKYCKCCFNLTDQEICPICSDEARDHKTIMVVENTRDLVAYEKTGKYDGVYHVLHGAISPMLGIGPNDIKLKELMVRLEGDVEEVIIATHDGMSARFSEDEVRPMGRTARGVKGITLSEGDFVVGCAVVDNEKSLLSITEGGFGKRCRFENFSAHSRGVKGIMCHGISDRTGKLAGIAAVSETDDILMITNDGTIIRTPVTGIPFYGRSAGGVIVMKLDEGAVLVNFAKVENEDETEAQLSDA